MDWWIAIILEDLLFLDIISSSQIISTWTWIHAYFCIDLTYCRMNIFSNYSEKTWRLRSATLSLQLPERSRDLAFASLLERGLFRGSADPKGQQPGVLEVSHKNKIFKNKQISTKTILEKKEVRYIIAWKEFSYMNSPAFILNFWFSMYCQNIVSYIADRARVHTVTWGRTCINTINCC